MKKIIIAGITGQDGSLLYDYLKKKNLKIIGLSRNHHNKKYIVKTDYSQKSLLKIINAFNPDEIYNFTGLSKPSDSWNKIRETFDCNLNVAINFLEIIKKKKKIKYFNSSSSEVFKDSNNKMNENSHIYPSNPYGIAKASTQFLVDAYRKKYNLFLVNGIFFNHSSSRAKKNFLLKYLSISFKKFKEKKINKIDIIDSRPIRDFGDAKDYVEYVYSLMQLKKPDNYVIGTGISKSVKQIVKLYSKFFNISHNKVNYKNTNNFNTLSKYKKADNRKILKLLKIKKMKSLKDVVKDIINNES